MNELLFFVLGLVIGGLIGVTLMCIIQINRINDYESKINYYKEKLDLPKLRKEGETNENI